MRHSCVLVIGLFCSFLSTAIGSYEGGYTPTHDHADYYEPSYPATPIVHPHHHHGGGHSAGSYYHYHVPLVGQQHYQPSYHHQDHSHYLWPLLLLLALPLLFLPLLPLLLLPIGISLLALLAPGAMMMMMMMMMMGGEMMMRRSEPLAGRAFNEMRTFGDVLFLDMTSLLSKYARSLDLDQCPQRIACEMGAIIFPENNATDTSTAKAFSSFLMEQYFPKGKVRRAVKQYEKAFWSGSNNINTCKAFNCQPTFKIYNSFQEDTARAPGGIIGSTFPKAQTKEHQTSPTTNQTASSEIRKNVNYIYPHSNSISKVSAKTVYSSNTLYDDSKKVSTDSPKPKMKRSHFTRRYGDLNNGMNTKSAYLSDQKNAYFGNVFGTPTIKS